MAEQKITPHGDSFGQAFPPLMILLFVAASYFLRPADRRIAEAAAVAG